YPTQGGILYGLYGFYHQMQSTGGSIEEAPTAFYFPADPNAPIPFAPRASRIRWRTSIDSSNMSNCRGNILKVIRNDSYN
ncbi:unnamed protein product, partial [Ixodes persulcatus]